MSENSDIDNLLKQLDKENKEGAPHRARKSSPLARRENPSAYVRDESLGGEFRIDPRDERSFTGDSLSVNAEDFTDLAGKRALRRRGKIALYIAGGLLFAAALGYTGHVVIESSRAPIESPVSDNTGESQPFKKLFPNAPQANSTKTITLTAGERGLTIPQGYSLTFPEMEFISLEYEATAPRDFGPAARANVDSPWNGTEVYLFKDIVNSEAFDKATNMKEVQVEGSPAAAVMLMKIGSETRAILALANPDSTGLMIALPSALNIESAENLASFIRVENADLTNAPTTTDTPKEEN